METLEERIKDIEDAFCFAIKKLKEELRQSTLFNPFKVGDWLIGEADWSPDYPVKATRFNGRTVYWESNGREEHNAWEKNRDKLYMRLATNGEIEKYLIEEARKRGFKDGCVHVWKPRESVKRKTIFPLYYSAGDDDLADAAGCIIYDKTGWAEVVEETKKLPKTVDELRQLLIEFKHFEYSCSILADAEEFLKENKYL